MSSTAEVLSGAHGLKSMLHLRTPKLGIIKDWRLGAEARVNAPAERSCPCPASNMPALAACR